MKFTKFSPRLVRAIPALALASPLVLLGAIYVLAVQPARTAQQIASAHAEALRGELARMQSLLRNAPAVEVVAQREFEMRTPADDRAPDVADAIVSLLNGPAVGGVSRLSIETGDAVRLDGPAGNAVDPRVSLFHAPITYTPMTVSFDSRYAQIGRFFWNLRALPSTFELRAVEIEHATVAPLMRTKLVLFVFRRPDAAPAAQPAASGGLQMVDLTLTPAWDHDPFARGPEPVAVPAVAVVKPVPKDPVVHTILFSSQWRTALIDGRIVRAGDRVGAWLLQAIEEDAVVFITESGQIKRLPLEQPRFRAAKR